MHLRRPRPTPAPHLQTPDAPPPVVATRACARDALALLGESGARAAEEARARAAAALTRENLVAHGRWRRAERLIRALGRPPGAVARH